MRSSSGTSPLRRVAIVLAVLLGGILAAPQAAHAATYWKYYFEFNERTSVNNNNLTLTWNKELWNTSGPPSGRQVMRTWRAGSGANSSYHTDECRTNIGWLPTGWYNGLEHSLQWNGIIKGTVWRLNDKACSNGTLRTELFIHSEMTPGSNSAGTQGGQGTTESTRWDGTSDYYSLGCIKLSYVDVKAASTFTRANGGQAVTTADYTMLLFVSRGA